MTICIITWHTAENTKFLRPYLRAWLVQGIWFIILKT